MENEHWLKEIFDGEFAIAEKQHIGESVVQGNAKKTKLETHSSDEKWGKLGVGRVLGRSQENNFTFSVCDDEEKNQSQTHYRDLTSGVEITQIQVDNSGNDGIESDHDDVQVVFIAPPATNMQCTKTGKRKLKQLCFDKNKETTNPRISKGAMNMFRSIGHHFMENHVNGGASSGFNHNKMPTATTLSYKQAPKKAKKLHEHDAGECNE